MFDQPNARIMIQWTDTSRVECGRLRETMPTTPPVAGSSTPGGQQPKTARCSVLQ